MSIDDKNVSENGGDDTDNILNTNDIDIMDSEGDDELNNDGAGDYVEPAPEDIEDDFDYDFEIYEEKDAEEDDSNNPIPEQVLDKKEPPVRGLRSKYSNWSAELDRIAELSALISKYAIKVEANTTEITDLWKFFAVMNEMWESMRYLFGWVVGDKIRAIKKRCRELLINSTEDNISDKVHNNLLYYRHQIYTLRQSVNLSFDLEKTRRGAFHKARKKIVQ